MKSTNCRARCPHRATTRILSIILSITMLLSISAGLDFSAYSATLPSSGTCGTNAKYTFDSSTGTLTISGGAMTNYTSSSSPFFNQNGIKSVIINVTKIGNYAFYKCSGIKSVDYKSNSLTSIGDYAFSGCNNLKSIRIIPSVKTIGNSAFSGCTGLISATICDGVTSIGNSAFDGCRSLTSVAIPDGITVIGDRTFRGCSGITSVTIPESVTSIGEYSFNGCKAITSIRIPSNVKMIGISAFSSCTSLTNVIIGSIEAWCEIDFSDSYSNPLSCAHKLSLNGNPVRDLVIPENVTNIGNNAFYGCTGLTSVTIPNSVKSIGSGAFTGCSGLTRVNINSLKSWCEIDFSDSYSNPLSCAHDFYMSGKSLANLVVPSGVTIIKNYTFFGCSILTNITIPNSITSIGSYSFDNCTALKDVYYTASRDVWNSIEISTTNNDSLFYAVKHYNYKVNPQKTPCNTHIWNSGTISEQPNCYYAGIKNYSCTICGATMQDEVPKTNVHTYNKGVITTQPTCTQTGIKTYTCTVCGTTKTESISATGVHSYNNGEITTQPSCTKTGIKTYTCTGCGVTKTESVPATGHQYNNGVITTQPTCTKTGVKTYTCTGCGATRTETVAALGHNYKISVTKAPTYEEDGYGTYTCSRCKDTYNDVIEQLTLPFNKKVTSYNKETYKITLNKSGYLIFDFAGESNQCEINIYDEDYELVTTLTPVFKEFYKKSYLQAKQGSTVPSENQIVPLLAGDYYVDVKCTTNDYYSGYYEMSIDYSASQETLTETKYNFYYDALTARDIELNKSYNGFLGGNYSAHTYNGTLIQTTDTRDAYRFEIPKGSGWSQFSVTISTKDFPPLTNSCTVIVYNEDFEPCIDFTGIKIGANQSGNETAYLYEGLYYIAVSIEPNIPNPIEYTFKTEFKPSGAYACIKHKYKLAKKQNPTCTKDGYADYVCDVCGGTYRETLTKKGHKIVIDKSKPATFKSSGLSEGSHCSVCGAVVKKQTVVKKLGLPSISKLTAGSKQFKATWKSVSGIEGYQIQYSTSSNFKSGNKTVTVLGYKSTSKTVKSLKAKKKYYVRIRAYKTINGKKQYSSWSKSKSVTTKK